MPAGTPGGHYPRRASERARRPSPSLGPGASADRPVAGPGPRRLPGAGRRRAGALGGVRPQVHGPAQRPRLLPGGDRGAGARRAGRLPLGRLPGHRAAPPPRAQPRAAARRPATSGRRLPQGPGVGPPRRARGRPGGLSPLLAARRRRPGGGPRDHPPRPVPCRHPRHRRHRRLCHHRARRPARVPPARGRASRPSGAGPRRGPDRRRPALAAAVGRRAGGGQHPEGERRRPRPLRAPRLRPRALRPVGPVRRAAPLMRPRARLAAVTALAALAAVAAVAIAGPAPPLHAATSASSSSTTPVPTSRTHITLASQTPWVAPGGTFVARFMVDTDQPLSGLELIVTVYFPLRTRSDFARSLDGHVESPLRSSPSTTLDQLQRDQAGAVSVVMPVQDPAKPTDPTALPLRREGVYPVQVEVRGAGGGPLLDRLTTHLLFFPPIDPTSGKARMDFAWALPLTAPVALQTGGSSQLDPAARATLSDLSQALTSPDHLAEPVDLVPTPETMHALSASADPTDRATLASLARAAQATEVVDGTYVPVDLDAMVGQGLGDELTAQRDRAERVLQSTLGLATAPGLRVVNGRLGDAALSRLRDEDVSKLVLPEEAFTPESRVTTLASPFVVDDHRLTHAEAASGDPGLAAHFAKGD